MLMWLWLMTGREIAYFWPPSQVDPFQCWFQQALMEICPPHKTLCAYIYFCVTTKVSAVLSVLLSGHTLFAWGEGGWWGGGGGGGFPVIYFWNRPVALTTCKYVMAEKGVWVGGRVSEVVVGLAWGTAEKDQNTKKDQVQFPTSQWTHWTNTVQNPLSKSGLLGLWP